MSPLQSARKPGCKPGAPCRVDAPSCLLSSSLPDFFISPKEIKSQQKQPFCKMLCEHTVQFPCTEATCSHLATSYNKSPSFLVARNLACFSVFSCFSALSCCPCHFPRTPRRLSPSENTLCVAEGQPSQFWKFASASCQTLCFLSSFLLILFSFSSVSVLCTFVSSAVDQERRQLGPKVIILPTVDGTPDIDLKHLHIQECSRSWERLQSKTVFTK